MQRWLFIWLIGLSVTVLFKALAQRNLSRAVLEALSNLYSEGVNLQNSKSVFLFSSTRWPASRMVLPRAEAKLYVSVPNVLLRDSIFIKTELENIKVR